MTDPQLFINLIRKTPILNKIFTENAVKLNYLCTVTDELNKDA